MLKQANQILGQVIAVVFFAAMGITPLVILVLGIMNYRRDRLRQAKSALQALGAVAIWAVLTFVLIVIFIMTVFSYPARGSLANETMANAIFTLGSVFYAIIGAILIVWTKRQTRARPPTGISC